MASTTLALPTRPTPAFAMDKCPFEERRVQYPLQEVIPNSDNGGVLRGYVTIVPELRCHPTKVMVKVYKITLRALGDSSVSYEISAVQAEKLLPSDDITYYNGSDNITYFYMPREGWSEYVKNDFNAWNLINNYFNMIRTTPEFKKNVAYVCGVDCVVNMYPIL
jgi:hypothetical protein